MAAVPNIPAGGHDADAPLHHPIRSREAGFTAAESSVGQRRLSHYIYRLSDPSSGDFYIGVRSCGCHPLDDDYMGSGNWPKHRIYERARLHKEVLAEFDSRPLAEEAELLLIDISMSEPRCRNSIKTASMDVKAPRRTRWGLR